MSDATGQECVLASYPDLVPLPVKPSRKLIAERPTTYIPFPRDRLFQERPDEFAKLEQLLLPSATAQQPMVAHVVKTPKSAGIRATFLLFTPLCSLKLMVLMLCGNTLRQVFGNQVLDAGVLDYKT